jgi:hypothetical protein
MGMKTLTVVLPVTNTLAAVVSKWKVFCIQSEKDSYKRIDDGVQTVQFQSRTESVQKLHFKNSYSDSYS